MKLHDQGPMRASKAVMPCPAMGKRTTPHLLQVNVTMRDLRGIDS